MATRHQRKAWINGAARDLNTAGWVWGNWIRNGFRKASEIDTGYPRIHTARGDIFCITNTSPIIRRMRQELIIKIYQMSQEPRPIFVDRHVFALIQEAEHG